ncbi:MAG: PKD domain-containing protein, partial [Bacteroidota bacterium]
FSDAGCIGDEFDMTVNINPEPVGVNSSYTYCSDFPFGIDLQQPIDNGGNAVSSDFAWSLIPPVNGPISANTIPPDGSTINPPPHLTGTVENLGQTPGILTYNVTPTSLFNCVGNPFEIEITINPEPVVENINVAVCSENQIEVNLPNNGNSYSLNSLTYPNTIPLQPVQLMNDLPYNYFYHDAWMIDTVTVGPVSQIVTYGLTAINNYNCESDNFILEVTINPIPFVDFIATNNPLCENTLIQFDNLSTTGIQYLWNFGDGNFDNEFEPQHSFNGADNYSIQLSATYPLTGCSKSILHQITIYSVPINSFSYSDSISCGPLNVLYTADTLNPSWNYEWDFGNGDVIEQIGSVGFQFNEEGCYDVSLTTTNQEGCSYTTTFNDIACMYDLPVASFSPNDFDASNYYPYFQFNNTSLNSNSFMWDFGDQTTSFGFSPSHLYSNEMANYIVSLIAYNEIGCTDTSIIIVSVNEESIIYVPNTFTPDGDEYNQTFKPILTDGFKKDSYHLMIFNRWGEVVFESYDVEYGWDGSYGTGGKKAQIGTYTWKIEISEFQSGETRRFTGHVNLIR